MRGDNASSDSRPHHRPDASADSRAHNSSAAGTQAQLNEGAFSVLVGNDVSFTLRFGVGPEGVDDLSVQMVAGAVGQNKIIRPQMDHRTAVHAIAGGGVNHPAVQVGTDRQNDFTVAHDVLGDGRFKRSVWLV